MSRVISVKEEGVTQGVLNTPAFRVASELREVTFEDATGAVHTVFAHKNGPFGDAQAVVDAWEQRRLHPHENDPDDEHVPPPQAGAVFTETQGGV